MAVVARYQNLPLEQNSGPLTCLLTPPIMVCARSEALAAYSPLVGRFETCCLKCPGSVLCQGPYGILKSLCFKASVSGRILDILSNNLETALECAGRVIKRVGNERTGGHQVATAEYDQVAMTK